jgi:hypothetical protein
MLANAQVAGHGMPRPSLVVQCPHLLMERHPLRPALSDLGLDRHRSGRWGHGNCDAAVRQGHPLTTDGVIPSFDRVPIRLEHLFKGVQQILQEVKAVGDLDRLGGPVARPIGIGFGSIASHNLHARMRSEPRG